MPSDNTESSTTQINQLVPPTTTLHLRGSQEPEEPSNVRPRVRWEEGTVDNEHMNKKKSKICCIFHPQQDFDDQDCDHCDSSDSSSSSSSSSSESETDKKLNGTDKRQKKKKKTKKLPSPNSYEIQPDYRKKKNHAQLGDHQHQHDRSDDGNGREE